MILKKIDRCRSRPVHFGRFIEVLGNILQDSGDLQHGIGNTDPQIDHDDRDPGEQGVGPEGDRFVDEAQVLEQHVHGTGRLQHDIHDHQGDELGHRDGEHEAESPEALKSGILAVDDHGQDHAQDIVEECREYGPYDGPGQDVPELTAYIAFHVQHSHELMQAVPVEQDQMLSFLGIGRKSHCDHVDQGDDIKYQYADTGKCHQGDMKVAVEQAPEFLPEARHLLPFFNHPLQLVGMQQLQDPQSDESQYHKACDHAEEQDLLGVVTGLILIYLLGFIPDLSMGFRTQL